MSSFRALCSLRSAKKQKHDFLFFVQWVIQQYITSVQAKILRYGLELKFFKLMVDF